MPVTTNDQWALEAVLCPVFGVGWKRAASGPWAPRLTASGGGMLEAASCSQGPERQPTLAILQTLHPLRTELFVAEKFNLVKWVWF